MSVSTAPIVVTSKDELVDLLGTELGPSQPVIVDQARIDQFADATGDHQWIHTDPERASTESPFGTTIGHGYLTLSLAPALLEELIDLSGAQMAMNVGCDKVRFPSPVPVNSSVSMTCKLTDLEDTDKGLRCHFTLTLSVDGSAKPACVAEVIYLVVI